jgi:hypothetical protein
MKAQKQTAAARAKRRGNGAHRYEAAVEAAGELGQLSHLVDNATFAEAQHIRPGTAAEILDAVRSRFPAPGQFAR